MYSFWFEDNYTILNGVSQNWSYADNFLRCKVHLSDHKREWIENEIYVEGMDTNYNYSSNEFEI